MSMFREENGRRHRSSTASGILLFALLSGCATGGAKAPASELVTSGWSDPAALAPVGGFDAYVAAVKAELRAHRVPFDPSMAEAASMISICSRFRSKSHLASMASRPLFMRLALSMVILAPMSQLGCCVVWL